MNAVSLQGVSKWFRHRPALFNLLGSERTGETYALRDVSIHIAPGESVALIGPNGSGKSTLLKLCAGLFLPDLGAVTVFGAGTMSIQAVRSTAAFVGTADRSFLGQLTAAENLEFFGAFDNIEPPRLNERVPYLLKQVGLQEFTDVRVAKLSSGNLQRLALARALLSDPRLLLLDEPSRSLDPDGVEHFWDLLADLHSQGVTCVTATHNMDEAYRIADRVLGLNGGQVSLDCSRRDLKESSDLRRLYFARSEHNV